MAPEGPWPLHSRTEPATDLSTWPPGPASGLLSKQVADPALRPQCLAALMHGLASSSGQHRASSLGGGGFCRSKGNGG